MTKKKSKKESETKVDFDAEYDNKFIATEENKIKKSVDPYSLDDIEGLGTASLKILAEEGYTKTIQIVSMSNPTELAMLTGKDRDEAAEIFARIKQRAVDGGLITRHTRTATEVLYDIETRHKLPTKCNTIDTLLNGGFESGMMYELYGENGAGKTQISHTLCVNAQLDIKDGGFSNENRPVFIYYIECEGTFRPDRIISILEGKKLITQMPSALSKKILELKVLTPDELKTKHETEKKQRQESEKYLDKIIVKKCRDPYEVLIAIKDATVMMQQTDDEKDKLPIKLIIVDSIAAAVRQQYLGRGNISAKKDILNDILGRLKGIAENYKIPVILINQIYNSPTEEYGADPDHSYGGNVLHHIVGFRLKVEIVGGGKHRRMKIIKSPYQANNEVKFRITRAGLEDPETK